MQPPPQPKIYHIVHVDRIPSIVADNYLWCDAVMVERQGLGTTIGMSEIKVRRLHLPVTCHAGSYVGSYVPFYFCPRSIMLYVIHRANHASLAYRGGQGPIVHLEADLRETVRWADASGRRWAFSLSNAGAVYAQFRCSLDDLHEVNWSAVAALDFRPADIKEGKQAEFLVEGSFPWDLVESIGVLTRGVGQLVADAMQDAAHRPTIQIKRHWYY